MAIFKVTFERDVRQTDRFVRFIEAETQEEADALAERVASDADSNCPDDAAPFGGDDCDSWAIHDLETSSAEDARADCQEPMTDAEIEGEG